MSRIVRAAVAVAMVIFVMAAGAMPAHAVESACGTSVVDESANSVLDVAAVQNAIDRAETLDLDIYVRSFETTPNETLEDHFYLSIEECNSWSNEGLNGFVPKGNVIWIGFGMDRTSFIYAGGHYAGKLDEQRVGEIRTEMGEFFGDGDFTGGIVHAVDEVALTASAEEPAAAPAPEFDQKGWDNFWSAVGTVFLYILGGIAVFALSVLLYILYRRRQRLQYEFRVAQTHARKRYSELVTLYTHWDEHGKFLPVEFYGELSKLPASTRQECIDVRDDVIKLIEDGMRRFNALGRNQLTPASDKLTTDEYDQRAKEYEAIIAIFEKAANILARMKRDIAADIEQYSPEGQQARLDAVRPRLDAVVTALEEFRNLFKVSDQLAKARLMQEKLDQATTLVASRTSPEVSHELISWIEEALDDLEQTLRGWADSALILANPFAEMMRSIERAREKLPEYDEIDAGFIEEAKRELSGLEESMAQLGHVFKPDRSRHSQMEAVQVIKSSVETLLEGLEEEEKKEKRRRKKARAASSYSSSSNDALVGGAIGYVIGSSSSSSYSSPSTDYGSSSGGSWGGGGDSGSSSGGSW